MVLYYLIKISFLIETNLALRGMYNKQASINSFVNILTLWSNQSVD